MLYYVVRQSILLTERDTIMTNTIKQKLQNELAVEPTETFNVQTAIRQRVDYLKGYLKKFNVKAIVLGISGGVDSSTAGKLAQMACTELQDEGYPAKFIAVRLPAHVQLDEDDAQTALKFINPDMDLDINIGDMADAALSAVGWAVDDAKVNRNDIIVTDDFTKGNMKARMRMISQYAVAGMFGGVVLGTDHNAEAVMGFYTKYGDGGCDLIVLNGLNKRQVRLMAKELGADEEIYSKVATADLEEDKPQIPDEVALGVTYDEIDDFLEGKEISAKAEQRILSQFEKTIHKREMPVSFE